MNQTKKNKFDVEEEMVHNGIRKEEFICDLIGETWIDCLILITI